MASNKADFDGDLAFGLEGERKFAAMIGGSTWELKTDRKARYTGNVFVEVEQPDLATLGLKPSGLSITKAYFWTFGIEGTDSHICVKTENCAV